MGALEDDVPYKMHLLKLTKFTNSQPRRDDEDQICTVDEQYNNVLPSSSCLPAKNQTLLVWQDALLVLDLGFHVVDGVGGLIIAVEWKKKQYHKTYHASASSMMVLPVNVLTKICILNRNNMRLATVLK